MPTWTPDPSFYPSPRQAAKAPPETLAYVAAFDPDRKSPDRIAVVDVDPKSSSYSKIIGNVAATEVGDEFHHFGLLVVFVPERAAPPCGATLPRGPWPALLAHLHSRHQTRSPGAENRQGQRAGGACGQDRLHPPSYRPLWPRGHLRRRPRKQGRQGARRRLRHGSREFRAPRPLGGRPRTAAAWL